MRYVYVKILAAILAILLLNLLAAVLLITGFTRRDFDAYVRERLHAEAVIARELIPPHEILAAGETEWAVSIQRIGRSTGMRFTVIRADGVVVTDSSFDSARMENHGARPEVLSALRGEIGLDVRVSPTLGIPMTYLALPLDGPRGRVGVIRVALAQSKIRHSIYNTLYKSVFLGAGIAAILAAVLGLVVARRYSRPIQLIKDAGIRIARGDFRHRLHLRRKDELSQLADVLNRISETLGGSFESLHEEKERLSAILSGMSEQLLVIGGDEIVTLANESLCRLLNVSPEVLAGRNYREVLPDAALTGFVREALESKKNHYGDLSLAIESARVRHFHLSASPIRSPRGDFRGTVVIFHDVTPIRELESMRREFVDNASHELKTPLSAILGVVETFREREPADAGVRRRFYHTLMDNTKRLTALINDLLDLSEIEHKKAALEIAPHSITDIVQDVVAELFPAIEKKKHLIEVDLPESPPRIPVDRKALFKALENVIDNAIKYTEAGGRITVRARIEPPWLRIDVADTGIGIPPEDIHRVFERFYRVDKARSIRSGGTGLGLAIVKHTLESLDGKIALTSSPGKGSVFSLFLPLERPQKSAPPRPN
jgi:two-component system phosphate regulon sensor histidine kinase PhoR